MLLYMHTHSIAVLVSAMQRGRAPLAVDFTLFSPFILMRATRSTAKGARGICIPPLLCVVLFAKKCQKNVDFSL